jgi:pimeloyl-ACP methyl ester carboxylesterase
VPILPIAINEAAQSEYTLLQYLTESNLSSFYGLGWGMYLSVNCQEELPFNAPGAAAAAIADAPASLKLDRDMAFMMAACEIWGVGKSPPVEDAPVYSDIPTLILAGEYDPITPPVWGRLTADTLSNAVYLEFPGLAHGVTLSHYCPLSILLDFFEDPTAELDASCIDVMEPPEFITDY